MMGTRLGYTEKGVIPERVPRARGSPPPGRGEAARTPLSRGAPLRASPWDARGSSAQASARRRARSCCARSRTAEDRSRGVLQTNLRQFRGRSADQEQVPRCQGTLEAGMWGTLRPHRRTHVPSRFGRRWRPRRRRRLEQPSAPRLPTAWTQHSAQRDLDLCKQAKAAVSGGPGISYSAVPVP